MTNIKLNKEELEVNTIYHLDIRRIISDNYDEEQDYKDYEFLSELALVLAKDSEGKQYSIIEFKKFNEAIERFIFSTSFPSIDLIEEALNNNEYTRKFLEPLKYQSMARIIYSSLKGSLSLKGKESLNDEFNTPEALGIFFDFINKKN